MTRKRPPVRGPLRADALLRALDTRCPEVREDIRHGFVQQVDQDYLSRHTPEAIATHLAMAARLDAEHPVQCRIGPQGSRRFEIVIVAFDYFAEFSILCGLLASFGLDIQSGQVDTFSAQAPKLPAGDVPRRRKAQRLRRMIVDVFQVRTADESSFDEARQKAFQEELARLVGLLERGQADEARAAVNRRVVERLAEARAPFMGPLYPIEVRFDNHASPQWTLMEIRGKDTPAFLFAFSNALALRGIYIHRVVIENVGTEIRDRLFLADSHGRKIEARREQDLLRVASVMIKQFTHSLASAPDPARAVVSFDLFLDKVMESGTSRSRAFLLKADVRDLLARLLGSSQFLWEDVLRMQFENLLPIFRDFRAVTRRRSKRAMHVELHRSVARARTQDRQTELLNQYKDREMFRIDMAHLRGRPGHLPEFSRSLTDLADVVLEEALLIRRRTLTRRFGAPLLEDGAPCRFAICGLGKFGGCEMGYASDIEILCVYGGSGRTRGREPVENSVYFEHLVQEIRGCIRARQEGIFHIDLRLRPYGSSGPLASPLEQIQRYYSASGEAAPFERQALIKLRWVAGDETLGREVEAHRDRFVYSDEGWDLDAAVDLRLRQINELVQPGTTNVKYGPGGVIDIEYAVQYLQVMHGKAHPQLRTPSTLEALDALGRTGMISRKERERLGEAYRFLRALIDGLRIVRGNARDLVVPASGSDDMKFLARRLGYSGSNWDREAARLEMAIRRHMSTAHRFFAARFDRRDVLRNAAWMIGDAPAVSKSARKA
jgi:glutamate-ammonia-ligase adenylyltransferase